MLAGASVLGAPLPAAAGEVSEAGRLARMILNGGAAGGRQALSAKAVEELSRKQFDGKPYGLG